MQESQRNSSGQKLSQENSQNFEDNIGDSCRNKTNGNIHQISDQLRQSLEQDKQFQSQPFYEQSFEKSRFNDNSQDDGVGGNKLQKNFIKIHQIQPSQLQNESDQDVPLQDRYLPQKSQENLRDSQSLKLSEKSPTKTEKVNNSNSNSKQEITIENSKNINKEETKEQNLNLSSNELNKENNASSIKPIDKKVVDEDRNQSALSLIYYDNTQQKYLVSDQAKDFLCSIDEKVAVIAVAGKYRTGKSFLLNRVILNKRSSGFGVGPTINPCTKGLWVWSETIETEYNGEKMKILVIDSEGIGAFDEDVNHDTKIFLLALLLSSNFIFNSMNTIDENAINSLSLIINLSKELQVKKNENLAETDPEEIQKFFPSFLWVVRDFSLRLNDVHGNTINQKQYLENALQPQKGNSDAVEQKNKIRRMIQLFFADRDCFTMVRPVENEKALQNLQQMHDNEYRPEFSQQITQLRNKILKRAKPKILNGKSMSGRMLFELCQAYTDAINGGSVPNIQNAWSYVCQNECQRTIKNCIQNYEKKIQEPLETSKDQFNIDLLKSSNKIITEQSIFQFRKDAMGGLDGQGGQEMIQDLEIKLRNQLGDKYKEIKKEYIRFCKAKTKKFIDEQTQIIRRKIQQAQYESLDQVQDELNQFKSEYNGPKYPGYEVIISETMCQLLQKASDFFTISKSQSSNLEITRLGERIKDLETTLKQTRVECASEKNELQGKIQVLQQENSQLLMSEKVMQERLKRDIQDNLQKIQKRDIEQLSLIESKDLEIKNLKQQLEQLDSQKRQNEFISGKKYQELEKLNALIEQKMSLTEKDLNEQKQKLNEKDKELKELQKENYEFRIQNQELAQKLERAESDCIENLEKQKNQYEKQIEKLSSQQQESGGNKSHQNANWIKEREQMTKQINLMTDQFESQKKLQEQLLQALNRQKINQGADQQENEALLTKINESPQFLELQQKNQSLLQMNNNLSMQIVQMQNKQQSLEEEIKTLKKYKKIVNNSMGFQCKHCGVAFAKDLIQEHLKVCMESADKNRASVLMPHQQASAFKNIQSQYGANPMQRISIMGQLPISQHQNLVGSFIQSNNHFRIEIQECQIYQVKIQELMQSNYQGVEYIFMVQNILEHTEWVVAKSLSEILELQAIFQKQYSTFDFQTHGISLHINLPQTVNKTNNEEMNQNAVFYFQDILKYEIQQFFEKLQKIPFVRDGQIFKNFFNLTDKNLNDQFERIEVPSQTISNQIKQSINIDNQNQNHSQTARFNQKSFACPSPLPFDRGAENKFQKSFIHGSPPSLNPLSEASIKQKHYEFENNEEGLKDPEKFKSILNFKSPNYDFSIPRPPSNRYRNDEDDDNLGSSQQAENDQFKQQIVQKDMDSSNVLCWTHDKLGQISIKDSRSMQPFKSNERNELNKANNNDQQFNQYENGAYNQIHTQNRDKNSTSANISMHYINTNNYQSVNRSYYRDEKEQSHLKLSQDQNDNYPIVQQSLNIKNIQSEIKKYKDIEEEPLREYKNYNNIYRNNVNEEENVNTSPDLSRDELQNSYSHTSTIKTEGNNSSYFYPENGMGRKESIKQNPSSQFIQGGVSNLSEKLVPVLAQHQKLQSFSGQQIVMTHHNIAKNGKMLFSQQPNVNATDKHLSSVNSLSQRSAAPSNSGVKSQTSQGFIQSPQFVQPTTSKHQTIKQGPNKISSSTVIQNGNSSQPRSKQKQQKVGGPSSISYEPVLLKQSISNNSIVVQNNNGMHNYSAHNNESHQILISQVNHNKTNQNMDRQTGLMGNNKSNNTSGQKLIKQNVSSPKNSVTISNTNQNKQSKH